MTSEHKMGNVREFDEAPTIAHNDTFVEHLGLEKIET